MGNNCACCVSREDDPDASPAAPVFPSAYALSARAAARCEGKVLLKQNFGKHPSEAYDITAESIGCGNFGDVRRVRSKRTGAGCAMKTVSKHRARLANVRNELDISLTLDQPHIIRIFDVFEDSSSVYMIFEECQGGKLLNTLLRAKRFAEIIDFGMAKRFVKGETQMSTKAGSAMYVAPEVLTGVEQGGHMFYNEKCDVWSAGVVSYILLSSAPPFNGESQTKLLENIMFSKIVFPRRTWSHVKRSSKELVKKMLTRPVKRRPTAEGVVAAWKLAVVAQQTGEEQDNPQDSVERVSSNTTDDGSSADPMALFTALQSFSTRNRFEKYARHLIARHVDEDSIHELREMFKALDKDSSGLVSLDEFKAAMEAADFPEVERVDALFRQADTDGSNQIDYTEFIAVTMSEMHLQRGELCWEAFRVIDTDGDGQISTQDLKQALSQRGDNGEDDDMCPVTSIDALGMLKEADADGDGTALDVS